MTEDAPPPESPTQATFTIKEKCTILGISSSSFDRYRKLGMPSDNPDEAKSWIQQKRVTLKEKSQKLGISAASMSQLHRFRATFMPLPRHFHAATAHAPPKVMQKTSVNIHGRYWRTCCHSCPLSMGDY